MSNMLPIKERTILTMRSAAAGILFVGGSFLFIRGFGIGGGAESSPHVFPGVVIGTCGLLGCAAASFVAPPRTGMKLFGSASDVVSLLGFVLSAIGLFRLSLFPDTSPLGPDGNALVNALRIRFWIIFGPLSLIVLFVRRRLRIGRRLPAKHQAC